MFSEYKKIVYLAAILAGIGGMAGGAWGPVNIGLLYFLLGAIFGFFWPREQWRWGLYISLPIAGLVTLSILFSGFGGDLKGDIFFVSAILAGSTTGSFVGSYIGKKSIKV